LQQIVLINEGRNNMSTPLVLTFDMGTQSARAMLVDPNGNIVMKSQKKYEHPYYAKEPGWAEQSANFYWESLCEVSLALKSECGELWEDIIAVTCTTIRDSCLCVDKNGEPLRDLILWIDKRETADMEPIKRTTKLLFNLVGMGEAVELQRRVSTCNWIKTYESEIWDKTYKYLLLSGYLNYKLTGKFTDSCASIIGHIPFDSKSRGWMKSNNIKRCIFDVEQEKLCDLVEPGDVIGTHLHLIATGSDKGCETLGLSCATPNKVAVSFGTTATIQLTTDRYMEPLPFIPAYPAVLKNHYNPEVQIYRGYWLISWFKKEFAAKEVEEAKQKGIDPEELLNERLKEVPAGCNGLIFQPYFTPGVVMPKARGSIIGFSDIHTRIHIYRAIIEGLNFALLDGMRTIERRGKIKIKKIFVAGGGSRSKEICQITANMFGLPVYRIQTHEASGLGSSIVAFVSKEVFSDINEAVEAMIHIKDEFIPDMKEHKLYEKLFNEVYKKIFPKLLPLYNKNLT
jgi:sugar (pentulose or hexulose) kinase